MIKANELRRFNKVVFAEDGTVFDVLLIEEAGLMVKNEEEEFWCEIDQFDGIPLTEEWLLRMGFEKTEKEWYFLNVCNDWTYLYWNKEGIFELSVNKHSVIFQNITSVHQLQNLYFALTGEELEIKSYTMS